MRLDGGDGWVWEVGRRRGCMGVEGKEVDPNSYGVFSFLK